MIAPGTRLGPYSVIDRLGSGGMGDVYLASDTRLERKVALKLLPVQHAEDEGRLASFRREALTLAALNHANIATIHGLEEPAPGRLVLVLEFVLGESLFEVLRRGPLPLETALHVGVKVAAALEAAHERKVIHRDLKPGNIMIGEKGVVKVLDFGISRILDADAPPPSGFYAKPDGPDADASPDGGTLAIPAPEPPAPDADDRTLDTGTAMDPSSGSDVIDRGISGTPGYMSPEQIQGDVQDARTDVFAFGCVLFECLAGQAAFSRDTTIDETFRATLTERPDLDRLPPRIPPRIRSLLEKCLEKSPDARFSAMAEVREILEDVLGIRRASLLEAGAAPTTPNNLSPSRTSFVGREKEIEECGRLLEEHRLLTLTGVGGSGKTRLARELVGARLLEHPDGVWFVDLAAVRDGSRVPSTVASVLGAAEEPGRTPLQSLVEAVSDGKVLLLLDNCEHLLDACAEVVAAVLQDCPGTKVVATSREALGVPGEYVFAVPTFSVPEAAPGTDPAALRECAAVRLFQARAAQARTGFELTEDILPAAAEICRQLDGIPLAIELAAARVRVLSVDKILAKLGDRFRLLTGGGRGAAARQQTLLATIQWSYDQLVDLEQEFFRALAVFTGGWTLEAATAVWSEDADEFEVLDLLTRLVDKSLVVTEEEADGDLRYRYLETVRQYAGARLGETGDGEALAGRHFAFFLEFAEGRQKQLTGAEQKEALSAMDREHGNLLAAVRHAGGSGAGSPGLRLVNALARYWSTRGRYELGRKALSEALDADGNGDPGPERATALVRLAGMALFQGDYEAARPAIEESLALYRKLENPRGVARALSGLATVATYQEDYEAARRYGEEVVQLYRDQGNTHGAAIAVHNLGFLAACQHDYPTARERYEEALVFYRESGDEKLLALTLAALAEVSIRDGRPEAAVAQLIGCLEAVLDLDARREGAYGLEAAAELAMCRGDGVRAAVLLGGAEAVRREIGVALSPAESAERDRLKERIGTATGPDGRDLQMSEGASRPFPDLVRETLVWLAGTSEFPSE